MTFRQQYMNFYATPQAPIRVIWQIWLQLDMIRKVNKIIKKLHAE
jgi:hypothetical protein